jgi:hypothetical protein
MMREFLDAKGKEGLRCEKFRPGALNQICLLHDAKGEYRDSFSVRNVCANGVCWTGKGEETIDYAAIHVKEGKSGKVNQNLLSMGFVIRYGKFGYWAGGDVSGYLKDANGVRFNYEAVVGKSVGPVTVCKTNHHAWKDAMVKEFVEEVKAAAYITNVWCPNHIQDCNMRHISSRTLYSGERLLFPTFVPGLAKQKWPDASWWKDIVPGGGHVVCCIPVAMELDLKKAAAATGEKSLAMLPMRELEPLTGYVRGGCSPVGMKKRFPTLIDETALLFEQIGISGGRRGLSLRVGPEELAAFVGATFADITRG